MFTFIGGRRHPFFVASRGGVLTDVVNRNLVEVNGPGQTTIVSTPPRRPFFYGRPRNEVIDVNEACPAVPSYYLPYAITVTDNGSPTIIAIKNAPKSRVKIKPHTELIIQ
jgi:hypothetical protein